MAGINTNRASMVVGPGATWGTAPDLSSTGKKTHVSQLTVNSSLGRFNPRDNGFDNFVKEILRLEETVNLTLTFDLTSDNWWPLFAAHFMGTASTPAEQTASQADYLSNLDFTNEIDGEFLSMSYLIEDDKAVEFPSVKVMSMAINMQVNQVGTITFGCIADQIVVAAGSQVNNAADIIALAYPTAYEALALGGTNHYFRINAQSGAGLTSGENLEILNFSCAYQRPMQTGFALRGASSKYTLEPQQLGPTTGTMGFQLYTVDDGVMDMLDDWKNADEFKCELLVDGSVIGTTLNRSIKLQFPRVTPNSPLPTGYDIPNANSLMQPTANYQVLAAAAAPTGMSGVTNYMRMAIINNQNYDFN